MELVEFLRARLDEDEAAARAVYDEAGDYRVVGSELAELHFVRWKPERVLAEVAAKRRLLAYAEGKILAADRASRRGEFFGAVTDGNVGDKVLQLLAQPYEGRPGWDDAWKAGTP